MKLAITEWNDRIAPVFDVTGQAIILEVSDDGIVREEKVALPDGCVHEYMPSEPHGEGDIAVELWKKLEPGEK